MHKLLNIYRCFYFYVKEKKINVEEGIDDWKEGSEWRSEEMEKLMNKFSTDPGRVPETMLDVWREERSIGEGEIDEKKRAKLVEEDERKTKKKIEDLIALIQMAWATLLYARFCIEIDLDSTCGLSCIRLCKSEIRTNKNFKQEFVSMQRIFLFLVPNTWTIVNAD